MSRYPILVLVTLFAISTVASSASVASSEPDPTAIAQRLEARMGGDAFAHVRVLAFTWAVERDGEVAARYEHTWDRWTGDYRLAGVDRESGEPWLALFNIDSREGRAWLGDDELSGAALSVRLERAYGRFINDSYWLLMPWKWRDPGVELTYIGREELNGTPHDVVGLSFGGGTGLTSGDRYWGYVDLDSGLLKRWQYVLQEEDGSLGEGDPTVWDWTDWTEAEPGVWLSRSRVRQGEGPAVRIFFPQVELIAEASDEQLSTWFHSR